MNWEAIGAIGELVGATAVIATLVYLAVQIKQSNSQQRREEIVSVQTGQNVLASKLQEPELARAYALTAAGDVEVGVADRTRALMWVVQCINPFELVYDLYHNGSLDDERYNHWEFIFVSILASKGVRQWWDHGDGKLGFPSYVRDILDERLNNTVEPPVPFNEIWEFINAESWLKEERSNN